MKTKKGHEKGQQASIRYVGSLRLEEDVIVGGTREAKRCKWPTYIHDCA
jgi:hypothetical protein